MRFLLDEESVESEFGGERESKTVSGNSLRGRKLTANFEKIEKEINLERNDNKVQKTCTHNLKKRVNLECLKYIFLLLLSTKIHN